jgi:hypothetical protein
MMLSDENDCSTKEFGQFFFADQLKNANGTPFHLPQSEAGVRHEPERPVLQIVRPGSRHCPADPTCLDSNGNVQALTDSRTRATCAASTRSGGSALISSTRWIAISTRSPRA